MPLDQQHEHDRNTDKRGEMSFFDHIIELRSHILRSVLAIAVVGIACFLNKEFVFNTLIFGPKQADFPTYRIICNFSHWVGVGDAMCFSPPKFNIITRELGEVLMQHLYVSFCLVVIGAFPVIFWEFWKFVRPGLHKNEQKAVRGIVAVCTLLFLLGVGFGYYIIAPFSISFLASYTVEGIDVSPSLDSYVTYMTMFTLPMGLVFELPVMAYFFAKIGLVGAAFLRSYRRQAFVIILIVAAIITPPDVVAQTLVTIPLYGLYELSILVVQRVQRNREKALKAAEKSDSEVIPYNED